MTTKKKNMLSKFVRLWTMILTSILIVLILIIMLMVSRIQGTARVVNYAGLIRGKTQRIIKLEDAGMPQDEMIESVSEYINGLRFGNEKLNLVVLQDQAFQDKMLELDTYFQSLKKEIKLVRQVGYENTNIIQKSETFFDLCDVATGLAESYSQRIATRLSEFEIIAIADIICIVILIFYELLKAFKFAKLNKVLKNKVYLDEATGLPNKNKCEEILTQDAEKNMAIFVFDLNNLRIVNNTQGHEKGDQYINSFARQLRMSIETNQFVGRYGGDEFIAVLKNISKDQAKEVLFQIKSQCESYSIQHPQLTLSYAVGFAYSNDFTSFTMRELFCQADKQMYIDKNQAKLLEMKQKRKLISDTISYLKLNHFHFTDCLYCDAQNDTYFILRASTTFFLAEDGSYSGAVEQILTQLWEQENQAEIRDKLQIHSIQKNISKKTISMDIPFYRENLNSVVKGKMSIVYLDADKNNRLHHFVLGFNMYYDHHVMDEKAQLQQYYDQLKQSLLENENYIDALMRMSQSIYSVNLTEDKLEGIFDTFNRMYDMPDLPCSYNAYCQMYKKHIVEDTMESFHIVETSQNLLKRFMSGDSQVIVEYQMNREDENKVWIQEIVLMSKETVYDGRLKQEKNIVRGLMLFRNVSSFHEKADLEKKELRIAYEKADSESRAKTEFMNRMSHDIRTPINGILGMMQIIRTHWGDLDKLNDCMKKIETCARHLNELVNDVLNMSKIESNHMEFVNEPFDLVEVMEDVANLVDGQSKANHILHNRYRENIRHTHLVGDSLQLRRIMINLLSNAIKYNKPNGTIDTYAKEVSWDENTATFEFKIIDTGIGMSQEYIDHELFEPFTQVKKDARTRYKGTGLGMAIVKGLIDQLKGTIHVTSQENVGTQITFRLTYLLDKQEDSESLDLEGMNILIVEDNEINMEIIQFYLESMHANSILAWDGEQAVQKVEKNPTSIDLILMDIMMPKMNGDKAAKKIKKINSHIPIIAMTAQSAYCINKKIMDDSISKPIDVNRLRYVLRIYLEKK